MICIAVNIISAAVSPGFINLAKITDAYPG